MKTWIKELLSEKNGLQIAPLIDVVFLLLIYFMVSSRLKKPEADLSLSLPGGVTSSSEIQMVDEQIIEVLSDGKIIFNARIFLPENKQDLTELEYILKRYNDSTVYTKQKPRITIDADDNSSHERVIDVLNACSLAGIKNVVFASNF